MNVSNVSSLSNYTNSTDDDQAEAAVLPYVSVVYLITAICSLGIIGNCMTLVVLFRAKHWTSVNLLLSIMSVSDLFALIVNMSIPLQLRILGQLSYITFYFQDAFVASSCLCAAIIGCERAFAVRKPLEFMTIWTVKVTAVMFIIGYCIFLSFIAVRIFVVTFTGDIYFYVHLYLPYFVLIRMIPFTVILVTNFLMIRGLIQNRHDLGKLSDQKAGHARRKTEATITRTVVVMTTVYFICMVPTRILIGLKRVGVIDDKEQIIYHIQVVMEIINFSVNIIIYTLTSVFFRNEYKKMLCWCIRNQQDNDSIVVKHATVRTITDIVLQ